MNDELRDQLQKTDWFNDWIAEIVKKGLQGEKLTRAEQGFVDSEPWIIRAEGLRQGWLPEARKK